MFQLIVEIGSESLTSLEYRFTDPEVRLGRSGFCHVQLPMECVSVHHLTFLCEDEQWKVRDEASTNGTLLNGDRLKSREAHLLANGDRLRIVDVSMRVEMGEPRDKAQEPTTPEESGQLARLLVEQFLESPTRQASAYLEVLGGRDLGQRRDLLDPRVVVSGCGDSNGDWTLSDPAMAAVVFVVRSVEGRFWLECSPDVSVNGAAVDRRRLLRSGDRITVGDTVVLFFDSLERYFPLAEGDPSGQVPEVRGAPTDDGEDAVVGVPEVDSRPVGPHEQKERIWGGVETLLLVVSIVLMVAVVALGLVFFGVVAI